MDKHLKPTPIKNELDDKIAKLKMEKPMFSTQQAGFDDFKAGTKFVYETADSSAKLPQITHLIVPPPPKKKILINTF